MQGVPGRTALIGGVVTPSGQPVARALRVLRATDAARAAKAVPPHVAAPLSLQPRLADSAGPL
ncbi:hypothetical protein Scani_39000 [Streptomyces caniferus]|uniref:Uncharacterized protein n=1 Tax=Streptomyces caniferus TaxID=285557 RepID=A0A640SAT4_9ACTN|nr:hypothetical protein Scani_39000 [Streptomyces caniferus]